MNTKLLGGIGAALILATAPAHAAVIDKTYTVSATKFGQPAPVDPVVLTFSVLFDTNAPDLLTPKDLTVRSYNLPFPTGLHFTYLKAADELLICSVNLSPVTCDLPISTNNFNSVWALHSFSTGDPNLFDGVMGYSYNQKDFHESTNVFVKDGGPSGLASSAPEPSAWALMIIGFGAVGAALRRRAPQLRSSL